MGLQDIIRSASGGMDIPPELMDLVKIGNIDMLLSGDSENMLDDMISKGVFKNKGDFLKFIVKSYTQNNMAGMMTGGKSPPESTILDIIKKTGIGKGYTEGDVKNMLVPLMITAFFTIYKYMSRRKAAKPI